MRSLAFLIVSFPALGHSLTTTQPSCSAYTLYYNNAAELASTASKFFSSMNQCSADSVVATAAATTTRAIVISSSRARTTSLPAVAGNPCDYSTNTSILKNPGFECSDMNNFGWETSGVTGISASFAREGSQVLSLGGNGYFYQSVITPVGYTVEVKVWARLLPGDEDVTGCSFVGSGANLAQAAQTIFYKSSLASTVAPSSTYWTQYKLTYTSTGNNDIILIGWENCSNPTKLHVDDFSLALVAEPTI